MDAPFGCIGSRIHPVSIPFFYSAVHQEHAPAFELESGRIQPYAEQPQRAEILRERLLQSGQGVPAAPCPPAGLDALKAVHTPALLHYLAHRAEYLAPDQEYAYPEIFAVRPDLASLSINPRAADGYYCFDIYSPIGRGTWQAACASAGLALAAARQVRSGAPGAYALCRPPGHHAGPDSIGGYCYLNNAALAALELLPLGRVALLDIDYHHGNGTQTIFWDDPRVLFASLHGDPDFEYPYTLGRASETGGSRARDLTFNLPLPAGTRGAVYLAALEQILRRIEAFAPAALVVSLGLDTVAGDPSGTFALHVSEYRKIGQQIAALHLPTVLVQEGGYAFTLLADQIEQFFNGFLG